MSDRRRRCQRLRRLYTYVKQNPVVAVERVPGDRDDAPGALLISDRFLMVRVPIEPDTLTDARLLPVPCIVALASGHDTWHAAPRARDDDRPLAALIAHATSADMVALYPSDVYWGFGRGATLAQLWHDRHGRFTMLDRALVKVACASLPHLSARQNRDTPDGPVVLYDSGGVVQAILMPIWCSDTGTNDTLRAIARLYSRDGLDNEQETPSA